MFSLKKLTVLGLLVVISLLGSQEKATAVGDSNWKPNTYDLSVNPQIVTLTGGETLGSTQVCLAPIFHFSNMFPNSAGGKLTQIKVALGSIVTLPTTLSLFIMDSAPSTTLAASCVENSAPITTQADQQSMIENTTLTACTAIAVTSGYGCWIDAIEVKGAEPKNTDIWVGIAITSNAYVVPAGVKLGIRAISRY